MLIILLFPWMRVAAADAGNTGPGEKLSSNVKIEGIELRYADANGQPTGQIVNDKDLITKDAKLLLYYTYSMNKDQISKITAGTKYYLAVSPHLCLPPSVRSPLEMEVEENDGTVIKIEIGTINSNGTDAWVEFKAKDGGSDAVISEYDELIGADFYLSCERAAAPPNGEQPIDGKNLYAMKFENVGGIEFGYAELEPVNAKAKMTKGGRLKDKTITWTIDYTPWQNPAPADGVAMDTPFELRDQIDTALHSYVAGSVKVNGSDQVDGESVSYYSSRDEIPAGAKLYVLAETVQDGNGNAADLLIIGGTKLNAGSATGANPAETMKITYDTKIRDELLLPGSTDGQKVKNEADLFAGKGDGTFGAKGISASGSVTVPQPGWITKEGKTVRQNDGKGSVTEWTVVLNTNGFSFKDGSALTFHDQLPKGSTLDESSPKVDGNPVTAAYDAAKNEFTISPIETDNKEVKIIYTTKVPEEMYDNGEDLGDNIAWCSFSYNGANYETSPVKTPVGSGDGSGTSGTATLVKTNSAYDKSTRMIEWTVTINPHKVDLKSGTFTDELGAVGGTCNKGHVSGLELVDGVHDIGVLLDGHVPNPSDIVKLEYSTDRRITVTVKDVGKCTITLTYKTKVCDPCIFANNGNKKALTNTISTDDMIIGNSSTTRKAGASSTADVSVTVLTKKDPGYNYKDGIMKWTVEVDEAGLPMKDIVLTDELPAGLTYVQGSIAAALESNNALANVSADTSSSAHNQERQVLEIKLGNVNEKTIVTFDTKVDPEKAGFSSDKDVIIENMVVMKGGTDDADQIEFEVSHKVSKKFANHGLVKSSNVNNQDELIRYEVLINPFGLALPAGASLVDTLDRRLQLDTDTLYFYKASLSGTTSSAGQKPAYQKVDPGQQLKITSYDPAENSFTVKLPIQDGSREAYVLCYTADIVERQAGGYGNSVRFDGGNVMLGGDKNNSSNVGGGGGGGGGGVAARKATIAVNKTDSDSGKSLEGVTFTLYQYDSAKKERGLIFAQGTTDKDGKLSFKVKPGAEYMLEETAGISGYDSAFGWVSLPSGVTPTGGGLIVTAGAAKTELVLNLTNRVRTTGNPDEGGGGGTEEGGGTGGGSGSDGGNGTGGDGGSDGGNGSGGDCGTDSSENAGERADLTAPAETVPTTVREETAGIEETEEATAGSDERETVVSVPQTEPVIQRDAPDDSAGKSSNTPKTGDSTVWLLAVAVLSGILLVILTIYHIWMEKMSGKK